MAPPRVSRACTACRTRKVRCNGRQPCQQCSHVGITCKFLPRAASAATRAQSRRGSVVVNLRSANHPETASSRLLAASTHASLGSGFSVNDDFCLQLLPDYCSYLYSTCPVIDTESIKDSIARRSCEADHAAFCYAYVAVTLAIASNHGNSESFNTISELISRSLQTCPILNHRSKIDLKRVVLAVFLRISFGILQNPEMEFFYHREAVAMFQLVYADRPKAPSPAGSDEAAWQRLHWVLFIYERLAAIAKDQPAILAPPTDLPMPDDGVPPETHLGFTRACDLYRLVDEEFLCNWRDKTGGPGLTEEWIIAKQEAFEQQRKIVEEALPQLTSVHRADLILVCQWLRVLVWQMATRKYLLRSDGLQDYMLLYFPVRELDQLESILRESEGDLFNRYGIGIVRKTFEVVDVVSDILAVSAKLHSLDVNGVLGKWMKTTCDLIRILRNSVKLSSVQKVVLQQKLETLESMMSATP